MAASRWANTLSRKDVVQQTSSWIAFLFILFPFFGQSQESRYMVFYNDKIGTPYTINQPGEFLSARSITRRMNQSISIDEKDLPVNPAYVGQVGQTGATVLYSSRWFNGSLVEATGTEISAIQSLDVVSSVEYVAPGKNGTGGGRSGDSKKNPSGRTSVDLTNQIQRSMLGHDEMAADGLEGSGVWIAVLDGGFSGVNSAAPFNHLIVNDQIKDTFNFAYSSNSVFAYSNHGTEVLSTMAGVAANYRGGTPDATYLLYVTEYGPTEFRVEEYLWALGAERADSVGADIISSSLGYSEFDDPTMDYAYGDLDGEHAIVSKAATLAFERGMVVVNSAGNHFTGSAWSRITPPADATGFADQRKILWPLTRGVLNANKKLVQNPGY